MDVAGKVVYAHNSEILTATLQAAGAFTFCLCSLIFLDADFRLPSLCADDAPDGQQLSVASRELGNTEVYAQTLQHSPNGRYVIWLPCFLSSIASC